MTIGSDLALNVAPGRGNLTDAWPGTVWSTPCVPGYHGIYCKACKKGEYKVDMSNVDCL